MTTEREIDEVLAQIGREHRQTGAPQKLESALRAAARGKNVGSRKLGTRTAWTWAMAMILLAAVTVAGVLWQARRSHESQDRQSHSIPRPEVKREPGLPPAQVIGRLNPPAKTPPLRSARVDRVGVGDSPQHASWNSLDEFVELPVSEGLPPAAEMRVVRVKLTGNDLQQYGLEAPADAVAQTLLAEFVVGEDGLPRAIRIVR